MAFGKTVRTEALDLLKAVLGELRIVAPPDHVPDHLLFEIADRPDVTKRRHRAAQAIGLFGGKARSLDRDPHRLLLKQRHAERLVQHLVQFVRGAVLWRGRWVIFSLD